jgi:hypothetical protein
MERHVVDDGEHPLVGIRLDLARANGTDRGTKSEDRRVVVVADKKKGNATTLLTTVQKQRAVTNGMLSRRMMALF